MKIEEKTQEAEAYYMFEKETVERFPDFFEGFADQKHVSFEKFLLELPAKPVVESPETVYIHRLHKLESDRYALRKVLFLQIEKTDDGEAFIAKIPWLDIFGIGKTKDEAIREFELSLIEDYEILKEEKDRLGDYLRRHYETLTKIIRELPYVAKSEGCR